MRWAAWLSFLSVLLVAPSVGAWTDSHPSGLVTEVVLDRDGGATVTLRVRWRVRAGRFRTFELNELPADFALLEATATDAAGASVPLETRVPGAGRLEVTVGEDGGLRRGAHDIVVRYTTNLRALGTIRRSGSDAMIEIPTVPWERGLEAAEIRVAVPAAMRRAQWIQDDTPGVETTVTSELGRDVVHAIRRHLPPGDRWTARVACDPTIFAWLDGPRATRRVERRIAQRSLAPLIVPMGLAAVAFALATLLLASGTRQRDRIAVTSRRTGLAVIVAAAGGATQTLTRIDVHLAVTAGLALALAAWLALIPRPTRTPALDASLAVRMLTRNKLGAREVGTAGTGFWRYAVRFLAVCAVVALGTWALRRERVGWGVAVADIAAWLVFAACAWTTWGSTDVAVLDRFVAWISTRDSIANVAHVAWRARGDGRARGALSLRIAPRPGHRLAGGARNIEIHVVSERGWLRWRSVPVLTVVAELNSAVGALVVRGAERVGRMEMDPDAERVRWCVELDGFEGRAGRRALETVIVAACVPASARRPSEPSVPGVVAAAA